MNRKRTLIVLLLALLSGSLAGYSALRYMRARPQVVQADPRAVSGVQVVVAARDLPLGHILGPNDVTLVSWPGDAVPLGYARTIPEVVGRGLITPVKMNEPLLDSKLADKAAGGGLPIVIPEGMRAVSFKVDEVVQVAGFVVPGTHVDLVLTINPPGETQPVTKIAMQNLQVLTAAQAIQKDAEGKAMPVGVVTVLVTPEQAEKLILATQQGRIQLALRNTLDVKDAKTPGIRPAALLSGTGPAPSRGRAVARGAAAPAPRPNAVEIIQGGVRSLKTF